MTDVNPVMVRQIRRGAETLYACDVCGLLCREKSWAEKCQDYCETHGACSSDITAHVVGKEGKTERKARALVLLSGGLDSMLAARLVLNQGVDVEAVHFLTPFSKDDDRFIARFCEELGIKLHKVFLGQEYLDMLTRPPHGYGSQMNPCVDCRMFTFRKAKALADRIGADFLVTGEVLDERPFSQRKSMILLIEREAGVEGKILRPLSARLLPESDPEKDGLVKREELYAMRGRRRTPQMELAEKLDISQYPNPSGGCLLTDPRFADRLREHLEHDSRLSLMDAELLRVGRHFRVGKAKIIVGRNEEENERLHSIAVKHGLASMEVVGHMGPLTVLVGEVSRDTVKMVAAITARYSDAEKGLAVKVRYSTKEGEQLLETQPIEDEELRCFIV